MANEIIITRRLTLRPIKKSDAESVWPFVSDAAISKDMSWDPHENIEQTRAFIENVTKAREKGKSITWVIIYKERICGVFSLISILRKHRSLTYNRAEIAYWLDPEKQGKGLMTEAGKAVLDYAFNELMLHKVVVGHHIGNKGSERLIKRLGFKFHYLEEEVFEKNGVWIDCNFYQLTHKDFNKKFN